MPIYIVQWIIPIISHSPSHLTQLQRFYHSISCFMWSPSTIFPHLHHLHSPSSLPQVSPHTLYLFYHFIFHFYFQSQCSKECLEVSQLWMYLTLVSDTFSIKHAHCFNCSICNICGHYLMNGYTQPWPASVKAGAWVLRGTFPTEVGILSLVSCWFIWVAGNQDRQLQCFLFQSEKNIYVNYLCACVHVHLLMSLFPTINFM
jgi:hypothetical protein